MPYTTFLLDLDHTLLDSVTSELAAFDYTLRRCGVEEPMVYFDTYKRINLSLWAAVERGEILPGDVKVERFELFRKEISLDADSESMAADFVLGFASNGELYPGALEVLKELAATSTLAMITNGLSEVQRPRIERLGIGGFFDAIVVSAEVGVTKPGAAIFDIAFERLGNPPQESAVMVGDSLSSDIKGGSNYGIATCWYNPHQKTAAADAVITHEIASLDELLGLRANQPAD